MRIQRGIAGVAILIEVVKHLLDSLVFQRIGVALVLHHQFHQNLIHITGGNIGIDGCIVLGTGLTFLEVLVNGRHISGCAGEIDLTGTQVSRQVNGHQCFILGVSARGAGSGAGLGFLRLGGGGAGFRGERGQRCHCAAFIQQSQGVCRQQRIQHFIQCGISGVELLVHQVVDHLIHIQIRHGGQDGGHQSLVIRGQLDLLIVLPPDFLLRLDQRIRGQVGICFSVNQALQVIQVPGFCHRILRQHLLSVIQCGVFAVVSNDGIHQQLHVSLQVFHGGMLGNIQGALAGFTHTVQNVAVQGAAVLHIVDDHFFCGAHSHGVGGTQQVEGIGTLGVGQLHRSVFLQVLQVDMLIGRGNAVGILQLRHMVVLHLVAHAQVVAQGIRIQVGRDRGLQGQALFLRQIGAAFFRCLFAGFGAILGCGALAAAFHIGNCHQVGVLHITQRHNQVGGFFLVLTGKGDIQAAGTDLHACHRRVLRQNGFQFIQNQHQIVVVGLQAGKHGVPVIAVVIVIRLVSVIVVGKTGTLLHLDCHCLLLTLQLGNFSLPAQTGSQQLQNDTAQSQQRQHYQRVLPQAAAHLLTGLIRGIQHGIAEFHIGFCCRNAQAPLQIIGYFLGCNGNIQHVCQLSHHLDVMCVLSGDNTAQGAAAAAFRRAEVLQHHGQFAELAGGVIAAGDNTLHHHLAVLHKGHAHQVTVQMQVHLGSFFAHRHSLLHQGRLFGLLAAKGDILVEIQLLAFLGCLSGLGEGSTGKGCHAVAAVVNGCHGETAGVGHLIVVGQHSLGHSPQPDRQFLDAVRHLGFDDLPHHLVILGVHREVHIGIGLQKLAQLCFGQIGDGNHFCDYLRGAKGKHDLTHLLEGRILPDSLQHLADGIRVTDHTVLHGTCRGCHGSSVQNLGPVIQQDQPGFFPSQLNRQHFSSNYFAHLFSSSGLHCAAQLNISSPGQCRGFVYL